MGCNEYVLDNDRAVYLGRLLGEFSDLIDLLEENDPQYISVKSIIKHIGTGLGVAAIIANALISYQLTSKGEIYWSMFGKWIMDKSPKDIDELRKTHKEFLLKTKHNVFSLKNKLKRLEKFYGSPLAKEPFMNPFKYCSNIDSLVYLLSKLFQVDPSSKTMVFAGKIYYYACKSNGKEIRGDIVIPVDRRNSLLTITSCIIKTRSKDIRKNIEDLMKPNCRSIVVEAWKIVSIVSSIPIYRLDSLTWLITGILQANGYDPLSSYEHICKHLGYCNEKLKELLRTLTECTN
ncbi:MAG: N-glycosylase/DNA lyase [Staphylothermus sp.]|nr:N-glycosylase/DNA lyase [Staphylothermus sp.]